MSFNWVILKLLINQIIFLGTVTQLESSTEPLDDVFFPSVNICEIIKIFIFFCWKTKPNTLHFYFYFSTQTIHSNTKVTICNLNQVTGSWFDEVKFIYLWFLFFCLIIRYTNYIKPLSFSVLKQDMHLSISQQMSS